MLDPSRSMTFSPDIYPFFIMNADWKTFLESKGARFADGHVADFGDAAAEIAHSEAGLIVADLSHLGVMEFAGEDAQAFLQGQLSNDVRMLAGDNSQWAAYCTPKGRMLASFLLWKNGENSYLAQLPASLREPLQKRLSMFVLRSKVKVTDASAQLVRIGVAGPGAETAVRATVGDAPHAAHGVIQRDAGQVLRLPGDLFELVLPPAKATAVWASLEQRGRPVGSGRWDWHLIRAGIPTVLPGTQEEFVPQMANFELINGVNFKKGCYPGQEIVARTQYLGKLKRRMYVAQISSDTSPAAGDPLYSADMQEQASGVIVNAEPAPGGGFDVLAVIQTSSAETEAIHWKALDGPTLRLGKLPYPLPV
jgi:folate-binding protein YgfZ